MIGDHEQLAVKVQLLVPQEAATVRIVRSRLVATATSFLLVDTKHFGQQMCLLAISVETWALNVVLLPCSRVSAVTI